MAHGETEKLWTRSFILICLVCLFTGLAMNMLNSTMAKYVYSVYGNASVSGIMNAVFGVLAVIGRLLAGSLSDRYGRRLIIVVGCILFATAIFFFGTFPWVAALVLLRGLQGLGYSVSTTADYAAAADCIPAKRMNEGIGYTGLGYCLAMAVGPVLALNLIRGDNYNLVFLTAAVMVVAGLVCALFIDCRLDHMDSQAESGKDSASPQDKSHVFSVRRYIEPGALPATLVQFCNCMAFAAVNSFIVLYAEAQGITNASLFFTFMAAAMCLARLTGGRISDRTGALAVIIPAVLLSISGFLLLLLNPSEPVFYLTGFLMGFSTGTANPVLQAQAIKSSPDSRHGAASGTYQLSNDIANGLGALVWGFVIDYSGYRTMFLGCTGFLILAVVLSLTVFRRQFSTCKSGR